MGTCVSSLREEIIVRRNAPYGADPHSFAVSRKVERDLERAQQRNKDVIKLLLLGSGNSGKSTVMKQFKLFLKNGFSMEERRTFRDVIWRSAIEGMRILAQMAQDLADNSHEEEKLQQQQKRADPANPPMSGDEFALTDAPGPEVESVRSNGRDRMRSYNLYFLQRVRDDQALWDEVQVPVATREEISDDEDDDGNNSTSPRATDLSAQQGIGGEGSEDELAANASFKTEKKRERKQSKHHHRKKKNKSAAPGIRWETMTVGRLLQKIWWSPTTQLIYAREEQFIETPLGYFMQHIDRIARVDYHPTNEDILMARKRTHGVSVLEFEKDQRKFILMDVGGQKTERKKWLAHFDNVHAVIFVVGLDQYDQILLDESNGRTQNRLQESMDLFEGMCQSPWFRKSSFILFLNKADIFRLKIKKTPITVWKSDYVGDPYDYDQTIRFIKKKFANIYNSFSEMRRQEDTHGRARQSYSAPELYPYVTCATDSGSMQFVISTCQDILLRKQLQMFGFPVGNNSSVGGGA